MKEQGHDVRTSRVAEDLLRDIRHALRGARRNPGFALAVVLTFALGIGGNTAIFSVVDQVLLRPLPYPNGDQLLTIYEVARNTGPSSSHGNSRAESDGPTRMSVSPANWLDWQRESRTLQFDRHVVLDHVDAHRRGQPDTGQRAVGSAAFFPLLGVELLLGRTVREQDDRPNSPRVAVLSYELWQRRFAGDPNVIGRVVQVSDRPAAGRFGNAVARLAHGATIDTARTRWTRSRSDWAQPTLSTRTRAWEDRCMICSVAEVRTVIDPYGVN